MVYIYILKLQNGKYYIGKTSNPYFRIVEHFNLEGSEWTKLYNPIKLLELIEGDDYDEDKYTKIYMDKYGIDNVRGGSYTSIKLDKETKNQLIKNSNNTNNRCFKCEKEGHFAKDCKLKQVEEYNNSCFKCGKYGHFANKCWSNKSSSSKKCDICGKYGHNEVNCYQL
jgi:hypothetical protein